MKKDNYFEMAGYNPEENVFVNNKRFFKAYVDFIKESNKKFYTVVDIGSRNAKIEYIKKALKLKVNHFDFFDFNYPISDGVSEYDAIFCFECLEHIPNQLTLVETCKKIMRKDGTLFISFPSRPKWLWTKYHYHEVDEQRFKYWILKPLKLKIIRKKKLRIQQPIRFYLTGIRPFFRLFYDYTNIYEIENDV